MLRKATRLQKYVVTVVTCQDPASTRLTRQHSHFRLLLANPNSLKHFGREPNWARLWCLDCPYGFRRRFTRRNDRGCGNRKQSGGITLCDEVHLCLQVLSFC